jgi:two-component system sensor histidine kinase RegB
MSHSVANGMLGSRSQVAPAGRESTPSTSVEESRGRLNLSWLVQLHWWAILGQLLLMGFAELVSGIGLPLRTLLWLVAAEAVANVLLGMWAKRAHVTDASVAVVMVADALVLTVLLDLTGGASNPFSTLFLVNVALGAVLLPARWAWLLLAVSLTGFGSLFLHEQATSAAHHVDLGMDHGHVMEAHLRGMWVAFAIASGFIVYFVRRVAVALTERERELREARDLVERREKLASLATLAAGAAHELSTPLSTIAVVTKELQRGLAERGTPEMRSDLQLVRDQVARCREILNRMSANAGESAGEPMERFPVGAWVEAALRDLGSRHRVRVEAGPGVEATQVEGPPRALAEALRGLLRNAEQASGEGHPVRLRLARSHGRVTVTVVDQGRGMTAEVLARVGEPFFTTKSPGEGMGLGLFLTRTLLEQLGGELRVTSRPGLGSEVQIDLPAAGAGERSES